MYLIRIQGKTKIPDYVQLRDDDYTLVAYFRADRPEKALEKYGYSAKMEEMIKLIHDTPFGKLIRLV
ncbi:MAG: fructose-6-phosphate aldolase, partial [Bacteroidetes bacterium]|nr:fructose-6-phosphate aldolase [Bacteroidota bacterium]